jgi:hypothetical protein
MATSLSSMCSLAITLQDSPLDTHAGHHLFNTYCDHGCYGLVNNTMSIITACCRWCFTDVGGCRAAGLRCHP